MKRALAWIWFLLLALLLFFGAAVFVSATPEELAFALGVFGFFLLANPLIFGYAGLLNFIAEVRGGGGRAETVAEATRIPVDQLAELEGLALALLWVRELAPYRYTYYGLFLLLLLIALAPQLAGGAFAWAGTLTGVLWGAAVPTVIVFGLELAAAASLAALVREREKAK